MQQLWRNAHLCTMQGSDYGLIAKGAVLSEDDRIVWVGAESALDSASLKHVQAEHDLQGALLTPGLIDCHTHLVYGGNRAAEFEQRLQGVSYETIAQNGGGIRSTVKATREASLADLYASAKKRALALMRGGVTTVEIKSGYGLNLASEAQQLRVARRLGEELPLSVRTTFLGAHALPIEFEYGYADAQNGADEYINAVCAWLPALHAEKLVDAVDAFCERIGFTLAQTQRVFEAAEALGLPVKLHAEQLSDMGGAPMAARFKALSCDHLEYLSPEGIAAMQRAGTVAVLLPAAYYFLRETKLPPIDALRKAGVRMAIATDHNPGTAPCLSLPLMLNMACTLFKLTPLESLQGVTRHAASALGLPDRGVLDSGLRADFALWDADHPNELSYNFGDNALISRVVAGALHH